MEVEGLEDELGAQFEGTRIPGAGDLTKGSFGRAVWVVTLEAVANAVELSVVEGVVRLRTELEAHTLVNCKRLVQ